MGLTVRKPTPRGAHMTTPSPLCRHRGDQLLLDVLHHQAAMGLVALEARRRWGR